MTQPTNPTALLILYNPYYENNVIESHLAILKAQGKVAFGKVKSKMRAPKPHAQAEPSKPAQILEPPSTTFANESWAQLMASTSSDSPLQLFLSDYANLYVCKVTSIAKEQPAESPAYYEQKQLDVELWFLITDMRELVRDDFTSVRDNFLANFITLHNNRTFAIYGNDYTYPLFITLKSNQSYFAQDESHYHNMFKTNEQIQIRQHLIDYTFGTKLANALLPDSMESLINAEIEYLANRENPLYDCTGIVLLYAKSMEQEIMRFYRVLFATLVEFESTLTEVESPLAAITYSVQEVESSVQEWLEGKAKSTPALGTTKHLRKCAQQVLEQWKHDKAYKLDSSLNKHEISYLAGIKLGSFINTLQAVRNPAAHASSPSLAQASTLRERILGIGRESVLITLLLALNALQAPKIYLDSTSR
ncbi:HP0729 family protein [Helicobacter sp.]|uniref:HP0729 family protein n=1 Tax=Helicobacter sp. TaxID=218 RepID=UPI0025C5516E|nr:HP0729 family protein [Helicobacter sp.]